MLKLNNVCCYREQIVELFFFAFLLFRKKKKKMTFRPPSQLFCNKDGSLYLVLFVTVAETDVDLQL